MAKEKIKTSGIESLTAQEKYYHDVMRSGNVLFIQGDPGTAKSSIMRSIANKLGMAYHDERLSMCDETDFRFPRVKELKQDGEVVEVTKAAIPEWAFKANTRPTLVHLEELNRCSLAVRNAALGILLERIIGNDFKFNDDVLFCASGNLGAEDGCDVEEFDKALNGRLIHVKHELKFKDWLEQFAYENCHPTICNFIEAHPDYFYRTDDNDKAAYASPRSWTFFSNYINTVYGKDSDPKTWMQEIASHGIDFVGKSAARLGRFIEEQNIFNVNDVINSYKKVKAQVKKANRGRIDELLGELRKIHVKDMKDDQVENVGDFLVDLCERKSEDAVAGYLSDEVENFSEKDMTENPIVMKFLKKLHKFSHIIDNAIFGK